MEQPRRGKDLRCPWCNQYLQKGFVGYHFELKHDCGVTVTMSVPAKVLAKEGLLPQ